MSDRVWAIVEAEDGGVFRSDNGGTNVDQSQRAAQSAAARLVLLAHLRRSDEGRHRVRGQHRLLSIGRWRQDLHCSIRTPHGDNHYLWIAPNDSNRMIECNDGGANVSTNGGRTWTTQDQQPTAQFYRVALDNDFPYHAYGAQQDNSTVRIATRSDDGSIASAIGTTSAAARAAGWRPIRKTHRSSMPAPTMACSPATTTAPASSAT